MRVATDVEAESALFSVEQMLAPKPEGPPPRGICHPAYLAEFLGTLLLVVFGDGAVARATVSQADGSLSVALGFGFGLTCALFVAGPVSGGHVNPAVTLASALFGKFPWRRVPGYLLAQTLGGFVAAALVYLIYWPAIAAFDGGVRQTSGQFGTAGIFATFPNTAVPNYNAFLTETAITAAFVLCILGMTDPRHKIPGYVGAIAIGLSLGVIGLSLGAMTGFALNPARDFGPRLFTTIAGWGWEPFRANNYYFWVPIAGPLLGAIVGALLYDLFIFPKEG